MSNCFYVIIKKVQSGESINLSLSEIFKTKVDIEAIIMCL